MKYLHSILPYPLLLSNIGKFSYSKSDVNDDHPGIVMDGTITVSEDNSSEGNSNINSSAIEAKVDTVNS